MMDGMRGVATLSVVAFHVALATGATAGTGWHQWIGYLTFGPAMFFMFSGFLLYRPFVSARVLGTPRPTVRSFARKRALRVIPGYWVALTLMAIYPGVTGGVLGGDWFKYYGMLQIYFPDSIFGGLEVSWTLATELSFYFVLPIVALLGAVACRRLGARRARTLEVTALLCVCALSYVWVQHWTSDVPMTTMDWARVLWLPGQATFFGAGMLLAVLTVPLPGERPIRAFIPSWTLFCLGCFGLAFAIYVFRMKSGISPVNGHFTNGLLSAIALLPAVFALPTDRGPARILGTRPMLKLGLISYGIYLYHRPIIHKLHEDLGIGNASLGGTLALLAAVVVPTAVLGAVSYYVVEQPALRYKYRRGRTRPEPRPEAAREGAPAPASASS